MRECGGATTERSLGVELKMFGFRPQEHLRQA
jgi:hypothetical protein